MAEAIPLLRQVIQEKPGYAEARYSLGKALLQQGETQEAIGELKKAVQLDPRKVYAHYQLGRAYLLAGQRKEAEQEFELTRNLKDQQLKVQGPQPGRIPCSFAESLDGSAEGNTVVAGGSRSSKLQPSNDIILPG